MTAEPLRSVDDPRQAAALFSHPLRPRLLSLAADPVSATDLAGRVGLSRQRVNYHVRQLARAGLLRRAGRLRKRNMIEQRYVATARAYVLAPSVLGPLAADAAVAGDAFSAARLVALAAEAQAEVSHAVSAASQRGQRLATLSLAADVRFESAAQRAAFTAALQAAIVDVVGRHAAPADAAAGRPYRLILACYPARPRPRREARMGPVRTPPRSGGTPRGDTP
jgi:DNA-binding transcriptional ArsR family regulator